MTSGWRRHGRGFLSVVILTLALAAFFQSWELAGMMIAVLMVHELGHILLIRSYGIDWQLRVEWRGVAVITSMEERRKLGHFANSLIHLSGPFFNLAYALLAIGLQFLFSPNLDNDYWLRLANLSVLTGLFNLLPIGKLSDGGKFVKRMFASLGEEKERLLVIVTLFAWSFAIGWIFLVIKPDTISILAITLMGFWFFFQVALESTLDDPDEAGSPQAMDLKQAGLLTAGTLAGLLLSTVLLLRTPTWVNEANAVHMFTGWGRAIEILAARPEETIAGLVVIMAVLLVIRDWRPRPHN